MENNQPSQTQQDLLSVPSFNSTDERREYLESAFRGEVPFPLMNGGMGIDFSGKDLVLAMMKENAIGVWAASAPGYEILRPGKRIDGKELHEYSHKERSELLRQWNEKALCEVTNEIRERSNGILGGNCMKILTHYDSTLENMIASKQFDIGYFGAGLPRDLPERMGREDAEHMYYVPIVSSVPAAELVIRAALKNNEKGRRLPDAFYVEFPQFAAGHLGWMNDDSEHPERFDPKTLYDEMQAMFEKYNIEKHIPIIAAGGITSAERVEEIKSFGYEGISMATPLLISQESGMPNELLEKYYLDNQYKLVVDQKSPTGFWSRRIDTSYTERTPESIADAIGDCVQCVIKKCKFYRGRTDTEADDNYCIARDLSNARFGLPNGILFASASLERLRNMDIYQNDGRPHIPKIAEILPALLNSKAAK